MRLRDYDEIVTHFAAPTLVLAGPGAGKTYLLADRVKGLLNNGVGKENITVLAFGRDANRHMREELINPRFSIPPDSLPFISTMHSLGLSIVLEKPRLVNNLRAVLNDVFGEENFVAVLVFDRNRKNDAKLFSVGHEYMVVYARDKGLLSERKVRLRAKKEGIEDVREEFERLRKLYDNDWVQVGKGLHEYYTTFDEDDPRLPLTRYSKVDERGPYRTDRDASWPGGGGPRYDVPHPITGRPCKVPSRGWVWPTYERMKEEIDKGNIVFGIDETTSPGVRSTLFEGDDQVMRSVIFSYAQKASQDFSKLFDGKKVFDNPKSYLDLEQLVGYLSEPGEIVVDFFAGSGTTAHGVMLANRGVKIPRRFIMVQLPEPLDPNDREQKIAADFCAHLGRSCNLAEIIKERLRRAGKKIREKTRCSTVTLVFVSSNSIAQTFAPGSPSARIWNRRCS